MFQKEDAKKIRQTLMAETAWQIQLELEVPTPRKVAQKIHLLFRVGGVSILQWISKDRSYKSKETRVITHTCRYSGGHLILNSS